MDFLGNQKAKDILSGMKKSGRFGHAFLVCGEEGLGKKTFAKIMAKTLLCENDNAPCEKCECCRKINEGIHPDVEFVTKKEEDKEFKVDSVRELIMRAYVSPNEASRRVFVLCDADKMNPNAQNALLKILEEPPQTAVFILLSQNREKMLTTILSRTVTIPITPVSMDEARDFVKKIRPNTDEKLFLVYGANIGKILTAAESSKTLKQIDTAFSLIQTLENADKYQTLKLLSNLTSQNAQAVVELCAKILENQISLAPTKQRVGWLSCLVDTLKKFNHNANLTITMTDLCIKLYDI